MGDMIQNSAGDQWLPSRGSTPGFSELAEAFLRRRNEHTMAAYRRDLILFARWAGVETITDAARTLMGDGQGQANLIANRWRQHLVEQKLAPSTVNRRLSALRSLVELANTFGIVPWVLSIDNVPSRAMRDTAGPGRAGFLKLLEVLEREEDSAQKHRNRGVLYLLFGLALRRFEVSGLDHEDLDLDRGRLQILGKKRTQREWITMSKPVISAMNRWLEARGPGGGPLFLSYDPAGKGDGRLSGRTIHRIVRSLGRKAGIEVWPHGLRHAAITNALDQTNGDVRSVQKFSRHSKIDTVLIYDDNRRDLAGKVAELVGDGLTPGEQQDPEDEDELEPDEDEDLDLDEDLDE